MTEQPPLLSLPIVNELLTLRDYYAWHSGKVSDKWSIYLDVYDRVFAPYRDQPVNLLEIGVQNGGALEVWTRFFAQAERLVGCDIDPACGRLVYEDPRVQVIIGNANDDATVEAVLAVSNRWDIVIDDGSHTSGDIVCSFGHYFPALAEGGVYVAEDLHCSYWAEFGGGLSDPTSSVAFFKRLADVVNHEHWGLPVERAKVLQPFVQRYGLAIDEQVLATIHSIEFVNSMCIVRKLPEASNLLGARIYAGQREDVAPRACPGAMHSSNRPIQTGNPTSTLPLPEERLPALEAQVASLTEELAGRERHVKEVHGILATRETELRALRNTLSWRVTAPLRALRRLIGTGGPQ